jgi:hypothetical protein
MIKLAKQWVLRSLSEAGYHLLKKVDYDALVAAASSRNAQGPISIAATPAPHSAGAVEVLQGAVGLIKPPPLCALAFTTARHLVDASIEGAVVDCGIGEARTLATLAVALLRLGDTSRRLVLFDTTADPLHRAETELALWGTENDLISNSRWGPKICTGEPAPTELAATGYPIENIEIRRYPREPIAQSEPVAFLGLTAESYEANQEAIATFVPRVSRGGVIAVGGVGTRPDVVDEYLAREGLHLFFVDVGEKYRLATKP